jgi:hypothetical protein
VYLVVHERDVILVDCVPLFEHNLLPFCARLRRNQLLEVAHSVVLVALDADLVFIDVRLKIQKFNVVALC